MEATLAEKPFARCLSAGETEIAKSIKQRTRSPVNTFLCACGIMRMSASYFYTGK